ncbi:hypothetical protein ACIBH1_47980 [Nonomuraea sp. NPDC050663]|uniref:hypothetical protein n=1 Tax=Nonomuraea sp. NPDC050663 TaxID=3364370 RepID=UPI0037BB5577
MPEIGVSQPGISDTAGLHNRIPPPRYAGCDSGHATLGAARLWELFAPRLSANGRVRLAKDGRNYRRRDELELTVGLPAHVAAVYVYDRGMTGLLVGDFDTGKAAAAGAASPALLVEQEAADFTALIARLGGECFTDMSPNGGRHVYVPWAVRRSYGEIRRLAEALARRYVTLDPAPLQNAVEGLIRPPGAWHRSGGYQQLTTPVQQALTVLDDPNDQSVWDGLHDALQPELEAAELPPQPVVSAPRSPAVPKAAAWARDEHGGVWHPRSDGPLPRLSPRLEHLARTGQYDRRQYSSPSEARQAVVAGAVACGWRLANVAARMRSGHWGGLVAFYDRYRDDKQRVEALTRDWKGAHLWIAVRESGREVHTRGNTHRGVVRVLIEGVPVEVRPPTSEGQQVGELQKARAWHSALTVAVRSGRWQGKKALTIRRVLLAMLKAAQLSRSTSIGWGVRHLALLACLDESTVAKTLKLLRQEDDPFINWVAEHRGERADIYRLIVPQAYAEVAAWRRWQPGRLGGIHPVFRVLGASAAFVYEQLSASPVRTIDLPYLTALGSTAVTGGLNELGAHGLAVRTPEGWVRGPADPLVVANQLGVPEIVAEIMARYRKARERYRAFLKIVEAHEPTRDTEDYSIPKEVLAALGPPVWEENYAHAPPACHA